MTVHTILTNRGYSILKDSIPPQQLKTLKKQLTLQPKHHPDYIAVPLSVYQETESFLRIPRSYGIKNFGSPKKSCLESHKMKPNVKFTGQLRPNQEELVETIMNDIYTDKTGLISLYTGFGKSILALYLMAQLGEKTIIVVHKRELLNQWLAVIDKFMTNIKVGIISSSKRKLTGDEDVIIIMLQTLVSIAKNDLLYTVLLDRFNHGLTIIDEVHHCPAETFSQVFFLIQSLYMIGLSASIERKDGLTQALYWHLGKVIIHKEPERHGQQGIIYKWEYPDDYHPLEKKLYSQLISKICQDAKRTQYIADVVSEFLNEQIVNSHQVLVLSDRIIQLETLKRHLDNQIPNRKTDLFVGGMKLEKFIHSDIILSTYSMFSEGLSLDTLNMIVFASPKKDIVQPLGRILRKHHQNNPVVFDFVDDILSNQFRERQKMYKKEFCNKIIIKTGRFSDDDSVEKKYMATIDN